MSANNNNEPREIKRLSRADKEKHQGIEYTRRKIADSVKDALAKLVHAGFATPFDFETCEFALAKANNMQELNDVRQKFLGMIKVAIDEGKPVEQYLGAEDIANLMNPEGNEAQTTQSTIPITTTTTTPTNIFPITPETVTPTPYNVTEAIANKPTEMPTEPPTERITRTTTRRTNPKIELVGPRGVRRSIRRNLFGRPSRSRRQIVDEGEDEIPENQPPVPPINPFNSVQQTPRQRANPFDAKIQKFKNALCDKCGELTKVAGFDICHRCKRKETNQRYAEDRKYLRDLERTRDNLLKEKARKEKLLELKREQDAENARLEAEIDQLDDELM